jgi:crotonobetainyl-CoA:carnitine CoA-transferase CaiB-like acyl-CoA transferase
VRSDGLMSGVRVIDLSRVLAGPFAAQVLAEMGADVVKVEHPDGDAARGIGPHADGRSLYFSALNSGKRGVVLDLAEPSGRAGLEALLDSAEIVVENFRADAAKALECDPATLLERHPTLTIVTVSGYAHDSERAGTPAFDLIAQAESGIMSVTGEPDGPPVRAGVPVGDLAAGLWAALAATAGYARRLRDGRGQHVEVPLIDATMSLLSYVATAAAWNGENPPKVGSGHHSVAPYGAYPTSDGWVVVAVIGDKFWTTVCAALGLDDLAARDDLATNRQRHAARDEVDGAITQRVARMTTKDALARLREAGVPSAPVNTMLDALTSPYAQERGIVAEVDSPEGSYRVVQGPLRTGAQPRPAPYLGEHTREVMTELLGNDSDVLREILAATPPTSNGAG